MSWIEDLDLNNLDVAQKTRIEKATKADMTPLAVHPNIRSGWFQGRSVVYDTTLTNCSCADKRNTGNTCKHMYRLAIELGLLPVKAKTNPTMIRDPIGIEKKEFKLIDTETTKDLAEWLFSLRIRGIKEKRANMLAKHFGTQKRILEASIDDFAWILPEEDAKEIFDFFNNAEAAKREKSEPGLVITKTKGGTTWTYTLDSSSAKLYEWIKSNIPKIEEDDALKLAMHYESTNELMDTSQDELEWVLPRAKAKRVYKLLYHR